MKTGFMSSTCNSFFKFKIRECKIYWHLFQCKHTGSKSFVCRFPCFVCDEQKCSYWTLFLVTRQ